MLHSKKTYSWLTPPFFRIRSAPNPIRRATQMTYLAAAALILPAPSRTSAWPDATRRETRLASLRG